MPPLLLHPHLFCAADDERPAAAKRQSALSSVRLAFAKRQSALSSVRLAFAKRPSALSSVRLAFAKRQSALSSSVRLAAYRLPHLLFFCAADERLAFASLCASA